jgi:hypothetical protein
MFCVFFVIVSSNVLFVCKCVLYYCHWVLTQLQLTNILYRIINMSPFWRPEFWGDSEIFGNFVKPGFRIEVLDENKREKLDNRFAVSVNFRVMNWSERAEIVSLCLQFITCCLHVLNKLCGHYVLRLEHWTSWDTVCGVSGISGLGIWRGRPYQINQEICWRCLRLLSGPPRAGSHPPPPPQQGRTG